MIDMVYQLYSHGVRIVPGTDNLPGFAYHRELELYVDSGISEAEVLQLATIRSAEVAGLSDNLGSLESGKLADMVLIDGNPLENISAIRNTVLIVKDGIIFDPVTLYGGVGVLAGQ
jgi:imidazolonepropionase-like amidohydrolase